MSDSVHIPVMLEEVLTHLSPVDGETYVDGTFGAGGTVTPMRRSVRLIFLKSMADALRSCGAIFLMLKRC
jgi:16S rRNA C1402 N4-methylase RsmH